VFLAVAETRILKDDSGSLKLQGLGWTADKGVAEAKSSAKRPHSPRAPQHRAFAHAAQPCSTADLEFVDTSLRSNQTEFDSFSNLVDRPESLTNQELLRTTFVIPLTAWIMAAEQRKLLGKFDARPEPTDDGTNTL
jgi:hypothetical protein